MKWLFWEMLSVYSRLQSRHWLIQATANALMINTRERHPDLEKELALLRGHIGFWPPEFPGLVGGQNQGGKL